MSALTLELEDFTGQIKRRARNIHPDMTVGDLVAGAAQQLHLPDIDASGRSVLYGATSQGESLNLTDRVGDVLTDNDVVTLTKSVTAG